jgi:hypothetical protein
MGIDTCPWHSAARYSGAVADSPDQSSPRLGRVEILGAWLGLWTPPRGVAVPPVPWRMVAGIAAAFLVALATTAIVVIPRVMENRDAARERAARAEAERHAAFLESVDREQRPRRGHGSRDPGSRAQRGERVAARTALLASAKSGIRVDAADRTGKEIRGVTCKPFPRSVSAELPTEQLARRAAAYDCVAVTARFGRRSAPGGEGVIGIPFRLAVHFTTGAFAWCRIVPLGDRDRLTHPLPAACRLGSER